MWQMVQYLYSMNSTTSSFSSSSSLSSSSMALFIPIYLSISGALLSPWSPNSYDSSMISSSFITST